MTQQEIEDLVEAYGSEEAVPLATGALMPLPASGNLSPDDAEDTPCDGGNKFEIKETP
jgi:hypothetical protein